MSNTYIKPPKGYYAIVDDQGLDQIASEDKADLSAMELRMRYNSHRNPRGVHACLRDTDMETIKRRWPRTREDAIALLTALSKANEPTITDIEF
jgi:hypothetical protein